MVSTHTGSFPGPVRADRRRPCSRPLIGSQLALEWHREMLAQADQQRLVGQLREHARASQHARRAGRRMARVLKHVADIASAGLASQTSSCGS